MSRDIFIFNNKNNPAEGYYQITEEELQAYKKNSEEKVYLINLGHSVMEVDEAAYHDFYKEENREDYRQKLAIRNNVISMESLISGEFNECNLIADEGEPLDEKIMREMMIEKLPEAIATLSDNEKELIQQIYFNHISDNELSRYYGVNQSTITRRKTRILKKLKNFFEK